MVIPTDARLLEPEEYGDNQCELIAKEYQNVYGGHIILIQPLTRSGAYDLGEYRGHFINKAWNKEMGIYYIDYGSKTYYFAEKDIIGDYRQNKNETVVLFDINEQHPPFPMIWHY